jgi:hypothetical protein
MRKKLKIVGILFLLVLWLIALATGHNPLQLIDPITFKEIFKPATQEQLNKAVKESRKDIKPTDRQQYLYEQGQKK